MMGTMITLQAEKYLPINTFIDLTNLHHSACADLRPMASRSRRAGPFGLAHQQAHV